MGSLLRGSLLAGLTLRNELGDGKSRFRGRRGCGPLGCRMILFPDVMQHLANSISYRVL